MKKKKETPAAKHNGLASPSYKRPEIASKKIYEYEYNEYHGERQHKKPPSRCWFGIGSFRYSQTITTCRKVFIALKNSTL